MSVHVGYLGRAVDITATPHVLVLATLHACTLQASAILRERCKHSSTRLGLRYGKSPGLQKRNEAARTCESACMNQNKWNHENAETDAPHGIGPASSEASRNIAPPDDTFACHQPWMARVVDSGPACLRAQRLVMIFLKRTHMGQRCGRERDCRKLLTGIRHLLLEYLSGGADGSVSH